MDAMSRHDPDIRALENEVKFHLMEGDKRTSEAEEHYKEAGTRLAELKRNKPYAWERYVKDAFNISRRRADELIQLADGRTTLEKLRDPGRKRMQKARARNPAARAAGSEEEDDDTNVVDFEPPKPKPKPNKEAVKYCSRAIDVAVKFHDQFTTWLRTEPELSDDDREALANSIQSAADTLSRLAQQIR